MSTWIHIDDEMILFVGDECVEIAIVPQYHQTIFRMDIDGRGLGLFSAQLF